MVRIDVHEAGPEGYRAKLECETSFVEVAGEADATTVTVGKVEVTVTRTQVAVRVAGDVVHSGGIG